MEIAVEYITYGPGDVIRVTHFADFSPPSAISYPCSSSKLRSFNSYYICGLLGLLVVFAMCVCHLCFVTIFLKSPKLRCCLKS